MSTAESSAEPHWVPHGAEYKRIRMPLPVGEGIEVVYEIVRQLDDEGLYEETEFRTTLYRKGAQDPSLRYSWSDGSLRVERFGNNSQDVQVDELAADIDYDDAVHAIDVEMDKEFE